MSKKRGFAVDLVSLRYKCEIDGCECGGEEIITDLDNLQLVGLPQCSVTVERCGRDEMVLQEVLVDDRHMDDAVKVCRVLVEAYSEGEPGGGPIDWSALDAAREAAVDVLEGLDDG